MSAFVIALVHESLLPALVFANHVLADKWMHITSIPLTRHGCR